MNRVKELEHILKSLRDSIKKKLDSIYPYDVSSEFDITMFIKGLPDLNKLVATYRKTKIEYVEAEEQEYKEKHEHN